MNEPASSNAFADSEAFTPYERNAAQEVELWAEGDTSMLSKVLRLAARPLDWAAERSETEGVMEEVNERIISFLDALSDASTWTYEEERILERARENHDLSASSLTDLRSKPLDRLDDLARSYFAENALLSAIEGGGTGLGGVALIAADVPMLFTLNLRLIQQIGAAYGFRFDSPEARPLVLRIFSAAAADTPEARQDALDELRVAGAAMAAGRSLEAAGIGVSDASASGTETTENQSRVLANEIARNVAARQMAQLIPLAGAATGAGMNYWFTHATAETAYMLSRTLYLEQARRQ